MKMANSFFICLAAGIVTVGASTLTPPVLPLLVRSPYLSTWLGNARGNPWERWPTFWTGQEVGLSVVVSVPDSKLVFPLLGRAQDSLTGSGERFNLSYPEYIGASYDASITNLTYNIPAPKVGQKDAQVILSFLSPITPTSTLRQAIPATYIFIHISGNFHVDLYTDINGLWVSGDSESEIIWEMSNTPRIGHINSPPLRTWKVKRRVENLLSENSDRSEWGTIYFSGPSDVNYEAGTSNLLRQKFSETGTLQNTVDTRFRPIMEQEPVFAFAKSFKLNKTSDSYSSSHESIIFTVAHIQDPVIQYASARGLTLMKPLWVSYYHTVEELIDFHYHDFWRASELAGKYSKQLEKDATFSGSENYKDILSLSARQVIGACSFSGTADDPLIFLKEISSDGNMNTVDVIYPTLPFFLYTNPNWLVWLMEPLIEHMLSGQYPNNYSMHDLGSSFPNATGHPDGRDEKMPVEECGNMLIIGLAIVNSFRYDEKSTSLWYSDNTKFNKPPQGKFSLQVDVNGIDHKFSRYLPTQGIEQAQQWIKRSYFLWKQWAGYLVRESLIPTSQLSTDDFAGRLANQTNLALKGIIGIRAMSEISALIGENEDADYYLNVSQNYIRLWQNDYAISQDGTHAKLSYTWHGSWTILYNLFFNSLLCFHLPKKSTPNISSNDPQVVLGIGENIFSKAAFMEDRIYKIQSDWYHQVRQRYGLPLDSRHLYTKSDWEFFAGAVSSRQVREEIMESVALWVNETLADVPLTDLYDTEGVGGLTGPPFKARPVVGGHFAFLALERACQGQAVQALSFLDEAAP